jgi:DNA-binding transcriptional MerR regulator
MIGMTSASTETRTAALVAPRVAAARVGVTTRTLALWADAGLLQCVRTAGGQRRYLAASVERLLAATASTAGAA